jgi:hypothetical protein
VTRLRAGLSGVGIPAGERDFLFSKTPKPSPVPTQPYIKLVPGFFHGGKAAEV